jgi:hypothetical protein
VRALRRRKKISSVSPREFISLFNINSPFVDPCKRLMLLIIFSDRDRPGALEPVPKRSSDRGSARPVFVVKHGPDLPPTQTRRLSRSCHQCKSHRQIGKRTDVPSWPFHNFVGRGCSQTHPFARQRPPLGCPPTGPQVVRSGLAHRERYRASLGGLRDCRTDSEQFRSAPGTCR